MKNAKKVLSLLLCAVLLVGATIAGTLAYLTDDATVTNTFTVGQVTIDLTEAPVGTDGQETTGDRVTANSYKLYPGKEYDKDPTVFVDDTSENCYIYVTVDNGIAAIETNETGKTIAEQMAANGWKQIGETGVYTDDVIHKAGDDKVVFEHFTIAGGVTSVQNYANATIVVKAYAIQAEGFANAKAAWDAAKGELGFTA